MFFSFLLPLAGEVLTSHVVAMEHYVLPGEPIFKHAKTSTVTCVRDVIGKAKFDKMYFPLMCLSSVFG